MPTRRLPARPNLPHLKHQAADVLSGQRARVPQVLQRLREFHPRLRNLSDAQIAAARLKLSEADHAGHAELAAKLRSSPPDRV
jgi:hypothetical protein